MSNNWTLKHALRCFRPLIAMIALTSALWGCKNEVFTPGIVDFAVAPKTSFAVTALKADTTIVLTIRATAEWTAQSDFPEWCDLSLHEGGDLTRVNLVVKPNGTLDVRNATITFDFGGQFPQQAIDVTQLSTTPTLVIESRNIRLDYQARDITLTILSNLALSYNTVFPDADHWFTVSEDTSIPLVYKYMLTVSQNSGLKKKTARLDLTGLGAQEGPITDVINLEQMYNVETLTASLANNNDGLIVSWTPSANAFDAYRIAVYDSNSELLEEVDVTGLTSYNIAGINAFKDAAYLGAINVQVEGIAGTGVNAVVVAQSAEIVSNSHFGGGSGVFGNPFTIECLRHFKNLYTYWENDFHGLMTCSYLQTADIILPDAEGADALKENMTPIGDSGKKLTGTYDGGNYAIKNVYIVSDRANVAPFVNVGADGKITRLEVAVTRIERRSASGASATGGLAAGIVARNEGTIEYCKVSAYKTDNSSVIYSNSTAVSTGYEQSGGYASTAGGIVGGLENGTVRYCGNLGCPVVSNYVSGGVVGGMIGGAGSLTKGTIEYCYNTADIYYLGNSLTGYEGLPTGITTYATQTTNAACAGGIVGRLEPVSPNRSYIRKCFNSGNMYSTGCAGGIVGRINLITIQDCYNTGMIKQVRSANSNTQTGGLIGNLNNASAELNTSYNSGIVLAPSDGTTAGTALRGIIIGQRNNANSVITDIVWLEGCGVTSFGSPNVTFTDLCQTPGGIVAKSLTDTQMKDLANYYGSFSTDTWVVNPALSPAGYQYPQIKGLPHVNRINHP